MTKRMLSSPPNKNLYLSLVFAIMPTLLLVGVYVSDSINTERAKFDNALLSEAYSTSRLIHHELMNQQHHLKSLTHLRVFEVALRYQRFEGLIGFFDSLVDSNRSVRGVLFLDAKGQKVASSKTQPLKTNEITYFGSDVPIGYGYSKTGESFLVVKAPIFSGEALKGYLVGVYDTSLVEDKVTPQIERWRNIKDVKVSFDVSMEVGKSSFKIIKGTESIQKALSKCDVFAGGSRFVLNTCISAEKRVIMPSSAELVTLLSVITLALGSLLVAVFIVSKSTQTIKMVFKELENLASGNFKPLSKSGGSYTNRYIDQINHIIGHIIKLEKDNRKAAQYTAIAKASQLLAHDIRTPFSTLTLALGMINDSKDPHEIKEMAAELIPEVERSLAKANNMISDIMEIGSKTKVFEQEVEISKVIEEAIKGVNHVFPKRDLQVRYDLAHTSNIKGDSLKLERVISNIVCNAIQAMDSLGTVWFISREDPKTGKISLTIGNSGSSIEASKLDCLFEAFYTEGKKGGTGLGLAIAQKIVHAHGGEIRCESSEEKQTVEFIMELPIYKPNS